MAALSRLLVVDLASTSRNWAIPDWGVRAVREAVPPGWRVEVVGAPAISDGDGGAPPSREALGVVPEAEAYFGFGLARPLFLAAPRLRWVHSAAAGVAGLLFPELVRSDVVLTNSAGIMAVPIAEHVIGGIIHLLRSFDVAIALQREGRWEKAPFVGDRARMRELAECRALVVGTGGIGRAVGERLAALGARSVVGVRRRVELGAPAGFERVVPAAGLDAELPAADVVVLATPLTGETSRLMTAERLDRLPPDAIVVNVARGALLDEGALAERVASGRLRGAVLDVFEEEPLASSSPLWQLPQILLTPHVSAVSPARFWERELSLFLENWRRYDAGAPLRNVVDKVAGY
ncbi:MAG: D-2-hydroxyacid dehydrogenase [Gemmatimonadaceae bacterium]